MKEKIKNNQEWTMNDVDARRGIFYLSEDTQAQVGTKEENIFHRKDHNFISDEGSQWKSEPSTPNGQYLQMQKDIYAYLLTIKHLIVGHLHLVVLCQDREKNEHLQIVPSKMGTHVEEPFNAYRHFLKAQSGEAQNKRNNQLLDDQIAQIYFFTIKISSLHEALSKCSQNTISKTVINFTGKRSGYLRNKFSKLKKINKLSYHEEVKCINRAVVFLTKYCPDSLYKFVREENTHVEDRKKEEEEEEENKNGLRKKYLSEMGEGHDVYPYLLVSVKRGITYHLISANNVVTRVGSCFISYKSVIGLFFLITGKHFSIERIFQLAKRGNRKTFDMSVGDIYGTSYGNAGLSSDLTASFFGNAQHIVDAKGLFARPTVQGDALGWGTDCDSFDSHSDDDCDGDCDGDYCADDPQETPHCASGNRAQKIRTAVRNPLFHSHSDTDVPHEGGLTKRKIKNRREKNILMVNRKCQSDLEVEPNLYSDGGFHGGRETTERLLFGGKISRKNGRKKKKSSKCYEHVRGEILNCRNDCVEGNPGEINQSDLNSKNGNDYQHVQVNVPGEEELDEEEEPNKYECDLSRSLLSIVIFNAVQQAYIHSQLYNVKNVFFSGYLLDHSTCVGLLKVILNFMYHNIQQLHFCTFSSYMSSFGSALQCLRWDETIPFC